MAVHVGSKFVIKYVVSITSTGKLFIEGGTVPICSVALPILGKGLEALLCFPCWYNYAQIRSLPVPR